MAELIDRKELRKFPIRIDHYDKENGSLDFVLGIETVFEYIEYLPTIEAKPIVNAHWEEVRCSKKSAKWLHRVSCSNCHKEGHKRYDFCPSCGAQMDEPFPQAHENGVKIPVISIEDVQKIMEEMEK